MSTDGVEKIFSVNAESGLITLNREVTDLVGKKLVVNIVCLLDTNQYLNLVESWGFWRRRPSTINPNDCFCGYWSGRNPSHSEEWKIFEACSRNDSVCTTKLYVSIVSDRGCTFLFQSLFTWKCQTTASGSDDECDQQAKRYPFHNVCDRFRKLSPDLLRFTVGWRKLWT